MQKIKCATCNGPKIDHEVMLNGKFYCKPKCLYTAIGRKDPDNLQWVPLLAVIIIILVVNFILKN
jgi:hypothetical protein